MSETRRETSGAKCYGESFGEKDKGKGVSGGVTACLTRAQNDTAHYLPAVSDTGEKSKRDQNQRSHDESTEAGMCPHSEDPSLFLQNAEDSVDDPTALRKRDDPPLDRKLSMCHRPI